MATLDPASKIQEAISLGSSADLLLTSVARNAVCVGEARRVIQKDPARRCNFSADFTGCGQLVRRTDVTNAATFVGKLVDGDDPLIACLFDGDDRYGPDRVLLIMLTVAVGVGFGEFRGQND